jgi:hypothetical protein
VRLFAFDVEGVVGVEHQRVVGVRPCELEEFGAVRPEAEPLAQNTRDVLE